MPWRLVRHKFRLTVYKKEIKMANLPGPQPDIKFCPVCKSNLRNVPRSKMKSKGYVRKDGTVSEDTHTYECTSCKNRFEINQDRDVTG